jgi:hypothetical protein
MATMDSTHANMPNEIHNINAVKIQVIKAMIKEGYISEEKGWDFVENYTVVPTKKSWYKRLYSNFFKGREDDSWYYDVVKFVITDEVNFVNTLNNTNIEGITSLETLREMLMNASKKEQFELAAKIAERIKKLEGK